MGHAYVTAEGCDEATVLGMCSSTDESLMESLLSLHGDAGAVTSAKPAEERHLAGRSRKARKHKSASRA